MFCPKCGTQNPETGKFCRSCGADIGLVTDALTGKLAAVGDYEGASMKFGHRNKPSKNPDETVGEGIGTLFGGAGFLAVAIILGVSGIIGGKNWWFWLLIPAGFMIGSGIANIWKGKRMARHAESGTSQSNFLSSPPQNAALPPTKTEYVAPDSRYKTGDLVPPSVTDGTTRHLEMNSEGETMTLPKSLESKK